MYQKAAGLLLLGNLILGLGWICVQEAALLREAALPAGGIRLELGELEEKDRQRRTQYGGLALSRGLGIARVAVSDQRVVGYQLVEDKDVYHLSEEDLDALLRIVEAEAGSEDEDGRLLVANVVLNRVDSARFPDTVTEVVFQKNGGTAQFSPVSSGRYYTVEISRKTRAAVERALEGEDISEGALFFASRKHASGNKMRWFDTNLTFLFEHGGHEFFK